MPCMPTCIASRGRARHRGNCTRLACGPGIRTRPKLTSPPLTPCGNWRGAAAAWRRRRRLKITHSPPNSPPCAPSGRLACPNPAMQPGWGGTGNPRAQQARRPTTAFRAQAAQDIRWAQFPARRVAPPGPRRVPGGPANRPQLWHTGFQLPDPAFAPGGRPAQRKGSQARGAGPAVMRRHICAQVNVVI